MNSEFVDPFQFSPELDNKFLAELFDGDIIYAGTVFGDFLDNLPTYWKEVEDAYNQGDTALLKSSVHKCKTLFGYVGHTRILQFLTDFENKCDTTKSISDVSTDFTALQVEKNQALDVVRKEHVRLLAVTGA